MGSATSKKLYLKLAFGSGMQFRGLDVRQQQSVSIKLETCDGQRALLAPILHLL